jgi:hypothetical protein
MLRYIADATIIKVLISLMDISGFYGQLISMSVRDILINDKLTYAYQQ